MIQNNLLGTIKIVSFRRFFVEIIVIVFKFCQLDRFYASSLENKFFFYKKVCENIILIPEGPTLERVT